MQQSVPVIIGCSLSGMAISQSLSQACIPHIMIGKAPNNLPRLGESINPEGSLELVNFFKDFSQFFYEKKLTIMAMGNYYFHCNFTKMINLKSVYLFLKLLALGNKVPRDLYHVDRRGFDQALFESVCKSSYLTHLEDIVVEVKHNPKEDSIESLSLASGEKIIPSYVFDSSNHLRIVGKALGVPLDFISTPQKVVYSHYHIDPKREEGDKNCKEWQSSTNLLRLGQENDGVNGFAWCIPLEDYISVGISMNVDDNDCSDEEILDLVAQAYARRGLDYKDIYNETSKIIALRQRYFIHERAYGKNWLLVGGAYGQIWFMSGSGVGTSLTAAVIAPKLLKNPRKYAQAYQNYMKKFLCTHSVMEWFCSSNIEEVSPEDFSEKVDQWLMTNIERVSQYPQIRGNTLGKVFSFFSQPFFKWNILKVSSFGARRHCPTYKIKKEEKVWSE